MDKPRDWASDIAMMDWGALSPPVLSSLEPLAALEAHFFPRFADKASICFTKRDFIGEYRFHQFSLLRLRCRGVEFRRDALLISLVAFSRSSSFVEFLK